MPLKANRTLEALARCIRAVRDRLVVGSDEGLREERLRAAWTAAAARAAPADELAERAAAHRDKSL